MSNTLPDIVETPDCNVAVGRNKLCMKKKTNDNSVSNCWLAMTLNVYK